MSFSLRRLTRHLFLGALKWETFWNSFSCDRSIAVLQSVPAFLLQTPGGDPAAPAQVAQRRMLP